KNDDWGDEFLFQRMDVLEQAGASPLELESKDAAMIRELQPGLYTVIASDFDGEEGIALIEVFELP
ncbi:MAG TPA: hypothetical protein DIV79_01820, partial [Opitutae bacterium]|nr:hypothetical protein [Opitutae bacterium]